MGYAARANKARRVKALQDGTMEYPQGILATIKPHETAPAHIIGGRLAAMLAIAATVAAPMAPAVRPRRVSR